MISRAEAWLAMAGLVRLARFDASGAARFDASRAGAARSFLVAVVAAPVHLWLEWSLLAAAAAERGVAAQLGLGHFILIAEGYVLAWTVFPVLAWYLCGAMAVRDRYPAFLCVYNWLYLVNLALMILVFVSRDMGGGIEQLWPFYVALELYLLGLMGFVAVITLGITRLQAAGMVALDLLVQMAIFAQERPAFAFLLRDPAGGA